MDYRKELKNKIDGMQSTNNLLNTLNLLRTVADIILKDEKLSTINPTLKEYLKERTNEMMDYLESSETGIRTVCDIEFLLLKE